MAFSYDNLKLDKGMYGEAGHSFTQVLEKCDPSEQYRGTPLEHLDAFQRQLKRFDIKVKGAGSDVVAKFFATWESAVLFPEYVARAVHQVFPPGEGQLQFIAPPRGRVGVHRPLLGEEGEEGLLHGVLFPVAGEVEVHRRASRTKGLWARSTSKVEVPSWPGHTRRFPSRETSRFRDWRIWP